MHKCKSALVTNIRTFNFFQVMKNGSKLDYCMVESDIKCLGRAKKKKKNLQQAKDFGQISARMQTAGATLISSD